MSDTTHLALPYLAAAQAQKHVTHNAALTRLDALVQLAVKSRVITVPPATPLEGDRYLLPASPTGVWAGQGGQIAARLDGQWQFIMPVEGFVLWLDSEDKLIAYDGAAWADVGGGNGGTPNLQGVPMVGINATADVNNRLSVASPASLFSHEGAGHQVKINKAAAAQTASLMFQTGFSGRAEIGTAGDDNLHVKVSANGTTFTEALVVAASDGLVNVQSGLRLQPQAADPATPADGQIWYNTTTGAFRKRQQGVTSNLDTTGGGGGLVDGAYGDVTVSGGGTAMDVVAASGAFAWAGIITPVALAALTHNYAPTGAASASVMVLSSTSDSASITGLAGGTAGRTITLINGGNFDIVLRDNNTGSLAANQFTFAGLDKIVSPRQSCQLIYVASLNRWLEQASDFAVSDEVQRRRQPRYATDFWASATSSNAPFVGTAISTGTSVSNVTAVDGNHPGIVRITSSTTANSGYRWMSDPALRIAGGESFECIFRMLSVASTTMRFGFSDSTTSADAVDGVYFEMAATGTLVGKAASNSVRSTTATMATLAINTWYRASIVVNADASSVTYTLYDGNGLVLATQSLAANIPVAAGRETATGFVITNSTTTATAMVDLDYLAVSFGRSRALQR